MASKIMDWDELYPGRFFKAGILGDSKPLLTISEIQTEELVTEKGAKVKGVLSFRGETLQLPLNKTNGICLREMFGRVPYKWVGKQFAIFCSEWAGEPAVRIWGSPELKEDLPVVIQLPRKKAFTLVMHAMGGKPLAAVPTADKPARGPRCLELMKLMGTAGSLDELTDIEADIAMETFTDDESKVLTTALAKRRQQIGKA